MLTHNILLLCAGTVLTTSLTLNSLMHQKTLGESQLVVVGFGVGHTQESQQGSVSGRHSAWRAVIQTCGQRSAKAGLSQAPSQHEKLFQGGHWAKLALPGASLRVSHGRPLSLCPSLSPGTPGPLLGQRAWRQWQHWDGVCLLWVQRVVFSVEAIYALIVLIIQ